MRRNWIERLLGLDRVYVTELTDGFRTVRARGPTKEAALAKARLDWNAEGGDGEF